MALPKTDSFTVTVDTDIQDYDANWIRAGGSGWRVYEATDTLACVASGSSPWIPNLHWEGDTFDANQYAQAKIAALDTGASYVGVSVRCASGTTNTHYGWFGANTEHSLCKMISGSVTWLGDDTTDGYAGELIRQEVS